ncbi:MAG: ABC transporter substrate-binding protein, partial [Clostridia bacterium]|nr:ABC transporter substrate-binding protein [Clostridia bacterium]
AYFAKVFPEFHCEYDNSNVEDVFASGAQVMYSPTYDEATVAQYNAGGVAYVQLGLNSIEDFMNTVTIIGDVLGGEAPARAKAFIDYFYGMIDEIQLKTKDVEHKTRVLALSYKEGSFSIGTSSNMQNSYLKAVGGELFTEEWEQAAVNVEDIIAFDPEVIFCNRADLEAITKEEDLQTVSAIKNGRVHIIPYGTFGWGVNNAEAAGMAPYFYAKYLYPELFEDLDLVERTQSFYKTFYNYDQPLEETEKVLNGTILD